MFQVQIPKTEYFLAIDAFDATVEKKIKKGPYTDLEYFSGMDNLIAIIERDFIFAAFALDMSDGLEMSETNKLKNERLKNDCTSEIKRTNKLLKKLKKHTEFKREPLFEKYWKL